MRRFGAYEHHIQNSKTDHISEQNGKEQNTRRAPEQKSKPSAGVRGVPLKRVVKTCPQIVDYAPNGIENWGDLLQAAGTVRSMLGVSPSAWTDAREAMGDAAAAVVMAAILERADAIHSAGGYLRALTERAKEGKFSVIPMLNALE